MANVQDLSSYRPPESREWRLRQLGAVSGVDAVFVSQAGDVAYVVTREHEAVNWDDLLEIERCIQDVHVSVRAHQGRDPSDLFPGLQRVG
jgi:hypothetical protein